MTSTSTIDKADRPGAWAKFFGFLWASTALLLVFSYWQEPLFLNLVSPFRIQLLIALTLMSLPPIFFFPGKTKLLFPAIPLIIGTTFLSYFIAQPQSETGSSLEVAVANVYTGNRDLSRLKEWLTESPVEILAVLEVGPHHLEQLHSMGFEHVTAEARTNNFGIALLSKEAPLRVSVLEGDTHFPSILAEYPGYWVLATHPMPPIDQKARILGDEQIQRLAKLLEASPKPTIVLGDTNAAAWDLRMAPLREIGLKDARKGYGILPTWPVGRPVLHIPIDHIFIPQSWSSSETSVGPDIGSDHYPLRASLKIP